MEARLSRKEREEIWRAVMLAAWGEQGCEHLDRFREEAFNLPIIRYLRERADSEDDYLSAEILAETVACRAFFDPNVLDWVGMIAPPGGLYDR